MKVYLAQINPIVGDLRGNAAKLLKIASDAYKNSSDLVITPEPVSYTHLTLPTR